MLEKEWPSEPQQDTAVQWSANKSRSEAGMKIAMQMPETFFSSEHHLSST